MDVSDLVMNGSREQVMKYHILLVPTGEPGLLGALKSCHIWMSNRTEDPYYVEERMLKRLHNSYLITVDNQKLTCGRS